jgi:hypothetical protein
MSDVKPSRPTADRNLLLGILALQMDFISRDALFAGMHAWVLDKAKSLGQILLQQGVLRPDRHELLEALVQKHLEMHDGDAQKSLADVSSVSSVRQELEQIADPDVHASLAHVAASPSDDEDTYPTRKPSDAKLPSAGVPTSAGLRFHILRPHAKGGLGEVFVAHDEELRREVALKEIQEHYADDPSSRATGPLSRGLLESTPAGHGSPGPSPLTQRTPKVVLPGYHPHGLYRFFRQLKALQARDIHLTKVPSQEERERMHVLRSTVALLPRAVVYA